MFLSFDDAKVVFVCEHTTGKHLFFTVFTYLLT